MKLAFVHVCGFRGYRKPVRIDFADTFTIIDGRNGVGKSTIFDAVEFALTGTITKYLDAKADRESVDDYLWWAGDDRTEGELSARFVEVGFRDGDNHFEIKRTPVDSKDLDVREKVERLFDPEYAPKQAITQLCASTIIRDEHIARLSLDLKESDRFTLLRDAIGAIDAEDWIRRAQALVASSTSRVKLALEEVEQAKAAQAVAARQMDQARAALPATSLLNQAADRLQTALRTSAALDQLPDAARRHLADIASQIERLRSLVDQFDEIARIRNTLPDLDTLVFESEVSAVVAEAELGDRVAALADVQVSGTLSERARQLEALVDLGRRLGQRDGHCPLCDSNIGHDAFEQGLQSAIALARQLDAQAVEQAEKERARDEAQAAMEQADQSYQRALHKHKQAATMLEEYDSEREALSLGDATLDDLNRRIVGLTTEQAAISTDLRLIEAVYLNQVIARAQDSQSTSTEQMRRAEARLGRARLAESRAKAIYDAARRAAAETLEQRLDRVLPLMSELYKRLRPHPVWSDIEYSVRGDVKRFLKLQVGGDINPQFVFSSGQRRATGLAFLLSVNLSIAWSRWRSILLDDPVQHVDDFRAVHLAEVLAQLCQAGRQIVCAVEDSALADLMCRRLSTSEAVSGKRITLGTDRDGALSLTGDQQVAPLNRRALVLPNEPLTA